MLIEKLKLSKIIIWLSWDCRGSCRNQPYFLKLCMNMTDPILYLSMILGLTGMYVLISSFSDDDDDSNDDGERDLCNLEYVKVWR